MDRSEQYAEARHHKNRSQYESDELAPTVGGLRSSDEESEPVHPAILAEQWIRIND